ncbi:hypothetical protein [Flavobacterium magnesitis]|uniref:hypothetical protein n=1 Tax=Flavobacterium magnesitis TaxID=3138077 RepID=UPI00358EACDF
MEASTQYTDLTGTVAADISDFTTRSNRLHEVANYFKIDQKRFKVIGISVYGVDNFYVSFICVDKPKSTSEKEHIVKISIESDKKEILELLFKRLHIVLYDKFDSKYRNMEVNEEIYFPELDSE